jgi:hypothetical protein
MVNRNLLYRPRRYLPSMVCCLLEAPRAVGKQHVGFLGEPSFVEKRTVFLV